MNRLRTYAVVALIGTCGLLPGRRSEASEYNVYYRTNANSPWVFYAGKETDAAANAVVTDLQATGYLTQIVPGNAGPAVAGTVATGGYTSPGVVVNRTVGTTPYGASYSGGWGNAWGGGVGGYSYGGGASYGGGGAFRNADNWHHHEHSHEHSHEGHHDAHAGNHHPTASPHHRAESHHSHEGAHHGGEHHGGHEGGHHSSHHGSHHGHSHSHSHSHSHGGHHGKK